MPNVTTSAQGFRKPTRERFSDASSQCKRCESCERWVGEIALAKDEKEDTGTEDGVEYSLGPICYGMCVR
jgi:hypothetical protein